MKIWMFVLLLLVLEGVVLPASAQNKILMLNGKIIEAKSYAMGDVFLTYKRTGDKKNSLKAVDHYDVYSVTDSNGVETIIYKPADSLDFSIEEARFYIQGEQVAHDVYRKPSTAWSSAIIGVGSSILSFYALPIPMIYAVTLGRFTPPLTNIPSTIDPAIAASLAFRDGFQKEARNLKIQRSLKWGYISLGVGFAGLIIYGVTTD